MAGRLAALERFFERIFERPAARLFRTGVEPVQVRHRLERAMDAADRGPGGFVPDRYIVRVHPDDLAGLGDFIPSFVDALVARARAQGYRLPGRPTVELGADPAVAPGDLLIDTRIRHRPDTSAGGMDDALGTPPGGTRVFEVPVPRPPIAVLLVLTPGVAPREFAVRSVNVRVGRGPDNDLVLADGRVSRHHGVLAARQGGLVYADVGSTNGSFVNGTRIREVALGSGDVLQLGDSSLTVHSPS